MLKACPAALIFAFSFSHNALAEEPQTSNNKPTNVNQEVTLDEIKVTGTKRSESLQSAVQSVTVFEEKDTIGMQYGLDVLKYVPNVTYQSGSFLPTVRGLDGNGIATGGGGAVSGARPRMTTYIDGIARTYSATPDGIGSFWDIEQVEVYKGSQSTQLGRNSIAGAIVQTTKDPKFKDEYAVQAGVHDQDLTYNAAFMANKKISDQVAIRLTGEHIQGDNFIDYSDYQGTGLNSSARSDLSNTKFTRYRFKALIAPSAIPDLLVKIILDSERNAHPYTTELADANNGRNNTAAGNYSYYRSFNSASAISATYLINNQWTFDSILSHQRVNTNFGPPIVGNPNPADYLDFSFSVNETTFEPKLNYQSTSSRTNAVIGAFYLTRSRTDTGAPGSSFALNAEDESKTKSLYADSTIELNNNWDLLLGGRLEHDKQERNFSAFAGLLNLDFKVTNEVFLPKIGATYHFTPEASLSLLAYQGYTASGGGLSFVTFTPYSYDKESAVTTELVARTEWLDHRLTANANIFYTRLRDTQVNAIGPAGPTDSIYINLDKARTYGAELMMSYQPGKNDRAFFSLGLLNTEIEDFGSAANNIYNGNRFALSPSVTARLGGYSEIYPNLTIGGDVSYTGKRYSDYQNTKADELDGYAITNLNTRYRYKNATFTGYMNNVFNQFTPYTLSTAFNQSQVNAPRTIGLNVKLDF